MQKITKEEFLNQVSFNEKGLIAVIAQQFDTKEVLMMAWMNKSALEETIRTNKMCYYSRSRQTLWRKGETSGHTQALHALYIDCDGDTLLALINQTGAACHTNNRTCFFKELS